MSDGFYFDITFKVLSWLFRLNQVFFCKRQVWCIQRLFNVLNSITYDLYVDIYAEVKLIVINRRFDMLSLSVFIT